mmetsp:Transcript_20667/g.62281  ORF Transcript_20667/g.62281 Transcript_20667/m.62281 type:complete len:227 (-) Transcript_20667:644-1324(-)
MSPSTSGTVSTADATAKAASCTAMSSVVSATSAVTDSLRHLWTPNSTAEAMHSASPQVGSPPLLVSIPTPMSATTADAQVVQATRRPERPTSNGTATTVKVEVKAPRAAVVISSPYACAVYPPKSHRASSAAFLRTCGSFRPRMTYGVNARAAMAKRVADSAVLDILSSAALMATMFDPNSAAPTLRRIMPSTAFDMPNRPRSSDTSASPCTTSTGTALAARAVAW